MCMCVYMCRGGCVHVCVCVSEYLTLLLFYHHGYQDCVFLFPSFCASSTTEDFDTFNMSAPFTHSTSSSQLPSSASCTATLKGVRGGLDP